MGNVLSSASTGARATDVTSESETMSDTNTGTTRGKEENMSVEEFHDTVDEEVARAKAKEDEMEEFRNELKIKREQRKEILARHRAEKEELERSLEIERKAKLESYDANKMLRELLFQNNIDIPENLKSSKENSDLTNTIIQMKEDFENFKLNNNKLRRDLVESNSALQRAYSDIADLHAQNTESIKQIHALKDVIAVSKTMINLREQQLNELKNKLNEIERSLADREANMLSADLRKEYERQLQNIRTLRTLYEERARLAEVTKQGLIREVEEQKILKQAEINKCKDLNVKVEELEAKVDELLETIENKNDQISTCQEETRGLKAEMSAVNKLFSQVLLGYKDKQDLDTLVHRLEENHGILTHMAEKENGSEASSALPKLLLELVSQVDEQEKKGSEEKNKNETPLLEEQKHQKTSEKTHSPSTSNTSAEEIVENLPKVWRVLMELLSHQSTTEENSPEKVTTCYKSVETNSGPVLVPSVSQTYIRLKDLIIEKLALIKEVNRMKQLNVHLENRLEEQERRLCSVTSELSKTWHVVGRLRRHHHQLHTHEKILKYELQQKRKLLNELKEELEYCREKWDQAREKNSQSEKDWRKLRAEFSSRKTKSNSVSFNNSAESGYSDERPSDDSSESNDENECVTEPLVRSRRKFKKSFETILDSSTDFNLAAEREDPVSDMLDVADLPLDTQEGEDSHDTCVSDLCNSESLLQSEKVCEETEDEVGDIANDSCVEESPVSEHNFDSHVELNLATDVLHNQKKEINEENLHETQSSSLSETPNLNPVIDPAAILQSIKQQNERLAKRDKKLESLEKSSAALLKQTQTTAKFSEQINSTLDHLLNRPTSSRASDDFLAHVSTEGEDETLVQTHNLDTNIENNVEDDTKDETLNNLDILDLNQGTSSTDNEIKEIAETLHSECDTDNDNLFVIHSTDKQISKSLTDNKAVEINDETNSIGSRDGSEPSSSSEIDHEARFAARDLRLKRLEEQTKSLVNKMNKTTTKGVKIHYKLEELHNIYGSENSRAGTPSEDIEETSQNHDDESHE